MSDETNDPAESPADQPAADAPPTGSVWDAGAPATPAADDVASETPQEESTDETPADEAAATVDAGTDDRGTDERAPEDTGTQDAATEDAGTEDAGTDGSWADEPVTGWAYQSVGGEASAETEAWDDESTDEPEAEPEPEPAQEGSEPEEAAPVATEVPAADDATADEPATDEPPAAAAGEDPAAQRAALEAELDRQLAALEGDVDVADDEDLDDDEDEDEPLTVADEADDLVDQLSADADEPGAQAATTEAEGWAEPEPAPVGEHADELSSIAEAAVLAERKSRGPVVPLLVIGLLIAAVIGVVVAVGGGGDKTDDATSTTTGVTTPFGSESPASPDLQPMTAAEALEYFQVYGTQDPASLARMIDLAAPDTPARYYAVHQETLARIDPQRNAPLTVTVEGEQVQACPQDPATGGCVTYSAFTKNQAGLITHFDINGTPLRDRVAIGAGNVVTANGMQVSIITRYVSVSDRLFLAYSITNVGGTPVSPVSVRYVTPSGETVEPDQDTFRSAVPPGGSIAAGVAFPTTQAGGTLVVTSTADGGNSQQTAQIQTP